MNKYRLSQYFLMVIFLFFVTKAQSIEGFTVDELIAVSGDPVSLAGSEISLEVDLTLAEARDIHFTLQDKTDYNNYGTQKFELTNSGLHTIDLNLPAELLDGPHRFLVYLTPVGAKWTDKVTEVIKYNFAIDSNYQPHVDTIVNFTTETILVPNTEVPVTVEFDTEQSVDLYVKITDSLEQSVAMFIFEQADSQPSNFLLQIPELEDGQYKMEAFITAHGAAETELLSDPVMFDIEIVTPIVHVDQVFSVSGDPIIASDRIAQVVVELDVTEARELIITLQDKTDFQAHMENRVTVTEPGTASFDFTLPSNLSEGNYRWLVYLVPTGGKWAQRLGGKTHFNVEVDNSFIPEGTITGEILSVNLEQNERVLSITSELSLILAHDFTIEVLNSNQQIVASASNFVEVSGTQNVSLTLSDELAAGDYELRAFLTLPEESEIVSEHALVSLYVEELPVLGDLDGDGDVDRNDIKVFIDALRSRQPLPIEFDFNGDGRATSRDMASLQRLCTKRGCAVIDNPVPRIMAALDLDQDGDVDRFDIAEFSNLVRHQETRIEFDINQDGLVNRCDIVATKTACKNNVCQ